MTRVNGKKSFLVNTNQTLRSGLPPSGPLHIGIDIGSVSCKIALLDDAGTVCWTCYERTSGRPIETAQTLLADLFSQIAPDRIATMVGTGSAGRAFCKLLDIDFVNELICQAAAISHLRPDVRTLIEMGGQDSKVIFLADDQNGQAGHIKTGDMVDFTMNTNCAAGTGSFLDQQASRLGIKIEDEFGALALKCQNPPRIAGRCSVFAKSDMIHLQQQAAPVHDIVAGLCLGLARNLKGSLCQGKTVVAPVAFCGGVASNLGVVAALEKVFELGPGGLIVPDEHAVTGAIGAVLLQTRQGAGSGSMQEPRVLLAKIDKYLNQSQTVGYRLDRLKKPSNPTPASQVHKEILQQARASGKKIPVYLGIDVGSISTNVVVMDPQQRVLSKAYLMTASRPLEAVRQGLEMVNHDVQGVVDVRGVATTGSGRYLTGDFTGADLVINEITAQATGAAIVDPTVDTIFEIGGQDSKYISLEEGVVVDFEMNHACAAGTGSFLEEQAERLGMSIKNEFADEAFSSEVPIRLGERCTVFMESDLLSYQQQGAERPDLVAGLCYSIVTNYLNRVVAHRRIGQRIFFQGGTAFNRAVVSAFEAVTGKSIVVPDHHEVTGALGAAELARRHMQQLAQQQATDAKAPQASDGQAPASTFRGFDLANLQYKIRSFECTHCPNNCEIKEVILPDADPMYYGSRCDRYNLKKKQTTAGEMPDLFGQRQQMLEQFARLDRASLTAQQKNPDRPTVGIPLCLSNYQLLPLWGAFFDELGFNVVSSGRSNKTVIHSGVEAVLSQTCFPIKVAHGHVLELVKRNVDFIWLPSIVSMADDYPENKHNQLCPYVQTIPYQVKAALQAKGIDLTGPRNHLLDLHVRFQDGLAQLRRTLWPLAEKLNVSKKQINQALAVAQSAQSQFDQACRDRGREILDTLKPDQKACVVVSRPYNGCDPGISLDLPRKLRNMNVLAIPMDFLDLDSANITEPELQAEMYWKYGQRIYRAAHIIRDNRCLNAIYISNFSCGPDSFIISMFKELMVRTDADGTEYRKPALVLEIDEHSADAGVITRLEAFHESLKAVAGRLPAQQADAPPAQQSPLSPWRTTWGDCTNRTLYIPHMGDHAHPLAAALRHCGQASEVLPLGDDETLRWGRQYTSGKECLPCIITTGEMLKKVNAPGFDPQRVAFFMPASSGPCRFGQYSCLQRLVLKQIGMNNDVPIVAPNQDSNFYDQFRRLGTDPTRLAYLGIAAVDLLGKVLLKLRPYERQLGQADDAYDRCLKRVVSNIENGANTGQLAQVMETCAADLAEVELDRTEPKPLVSVVGEIYVRSHSFANGNIVRQLEQLGAEVNLAGFAEWLYYTNHTRKLMAGRWGDWRLYLQNITKGYFQHKIEKRLARPLEQRFGPIAEGNVTDVIDVATPYMHESFEGEAILSIGKMVEMAHHGAAGAVNVMPFTCMPSTIVSGIARQVSIETGGMPIISVSYDGQQDPTLPTRLEAFIHQARMFSRRERSRTAIPAH